MPTTCTGSSRFNLLAGRTRIRRDRAGDYRQMAWRRRKARGSRRRRTRRSHLREIGHAYRLAVRGRRSSCSSRRSGRMSVEIHRLNARWRTARQPVVKGIRHTEGVQGIGQKVLVVVTGRLTRHQANRIRYRAVTIRSRLCCSGGGCVRIVVL